MKKFSAFVSGVIMGAITGAILATLFAPTSGSLLREKIQERYDALRTDVNNAAAERTKELREELARLQKREIPTE